MLIEDFDRLAFSAKRPQLDEAPLLYWAVGLGGEAGEVLNEVKKAYRDDTVRDDEILDEAGDVLFYLRNTLHKRGMTVEQAVQHCLAKLTAIDGIERL